MGIAIHNGTAGSNYYAKPSPAASGAWDADDIALTVNPNLSSQFTFTSDPNTPYDIYLRAGASPASSDLIVATLGVESSGGGLTGPYTRTITILDDDTDEPIEGAYVRLYRTGETETQPTDTDGEAVFTTGAYTFTLAVTASGYVGSSQSLAISANGSTAVRLVATSITVPDDPALATLVVKCLDETGAIEPGAIVYVRLVGIPSDSIGLSFDGISQEATANNSGNATLTIVKLAKYQIRRGDTQQWKEFTASSANSQTITSFIGVDPVVTS